MITVKGKVGKAYIVQAITGYSKCLVIFDSEWKSIAASISNGTDCFEISKFDDTFKVRDQIIDLIRNSEDKYTYLVVYSNSGKLINNWLENLFNNMQSEINTKFRDIIFFKNE